MMNAEKLKAQAKETFQPVLDLLDQLSKEVRKKNLQGRQL